MLIPFGPSPPLPFARKMPRFATWWLGAAGGWSMGPPLLKIFFLLVSIILTQFSRLGRPVAVAYGVLQNPITVGPRRLGLPPWRTTKRPQPPWATAAAFPPTRWARGRWHNRCGVAVSIDSWFYYVLLLFSSAPWLPIKVYLRKQFGGCHHDESA
jgi:hypothetical protein